MTYRGPSESQSNAEALVRRGSPYTAASDMSFRVRWDSNRREPDNLRDAVRLARRAYSDEVPDKLHEGYDSIGEGGTPKMTDRAVGYIMGDPEGDDAARDPETGQRDLAGWHYSPFRANLSVMARGTETQRLYAAIVQSITIGGQDPRGSALSAGVRPRVHGEVGGAHGAARVPALDDGSETACTGGSGMSGVKGWHFTEEQKVRMREGQAKIPVSVRRSRARLGALAIHEAGKTNTGPATAAFMSRFQTDEERVAYMRELGVKAVAARRHKRMYPVLAKGASTA